MTIIEYWHAALITSIAPLEELPGKTSSQIFLSRGVAGTDTEPPSPRPAGDPLVASIYESESAHIMTVGNAATRTVSAGLDGEAELSRRPNSEATEVCRLKNIGRAPTSDSLRVQHGSACSNGVPSTFEDDYDEPDFKGKGKGKDIDRGRSIDRKHRYPNPLARAESWSRRDDTAIEVDVSPMEKRAISRSNTFYKNPSDPRAALDDHLLEPCPSSVCNSVSEVMTSPEGGHVAHRFGTQKSSTWSSNQASLKQQLPRALTTVLNECQPHFPEPKLPAENICQIRPDIARLEKSATETTHHDATTTPTRSSRTSSHLPSRQSVASKTPTEILQQIYSYLQPADFNSARHTCRAWYLNSLHRPLLQMMLQRKGLSSSVINNCSVTTLAGRSPSLSNEWLMSKVIARECALGPDWTGPGLRTTTDESKSFQDANAAFHQASHIDFGEIAVRYPGSRTAGISFTVSSCNRFLMVANGCMVYVYALNHDAFGPSVGSLRPITSIICPRRVLACSMDTSSHRYAVAILLDGRMGMVIDISNMNRTLKPTLSERTSGGEPSQAGGTSFLDRITLNTSSPVTGVGRTNTEPPFVFPGIATTGNSDAGFDPTAWLPFFSQADVPIHVRTAGPSSQYDTLSRTNVVNTDQSVPNFARDGKRMQELNTLSMPIETGSRSLYRNLCSDDDPPRSVAICPQRRCVAFGCSSGIELHWVDALTGQDLNRWFPLTSPSDFLYFLPPRKSVDSAKKLRLISSSSRPNERPAIADRSFGGRASNSPFWEQLGYDDPVEMVEGDTRGTLSRLRGAPRRTASSQNSDHYKAIPLSDGYNVLYTDPTTGYLCLGSDAPVGGPTKLLRKIWFKGPEGMGSPVAYAAGSDLSCGVRVVAAFGTGAQHTVWLYSVPSDIYIANQLDSSIYLHSVFSTPSSSGEARANDWVKWLPDDGLHEWWNHSSDPVAGIFPRSVWPVKIRGQIIGTCSGIVDLAIDSGPEMIIWAFSKEAKAVVWKFADGTTSGVTKNHLVMRDGTVRQGDTDGDTEMTDSPISTPDILEPPLSLIPGSFDGAASYTSLSPRTYSRRSEITRYFQERDNVSTEYDADGDVLMSGVDDEKIHHSRRTEWRSWEELVFEQYGGEMWYERKYSVKQNFKGPSRDLVEELTGAARIEVELR